MTIFFVLFSRGVVCLCAEFPQETVAVKGTPSQLNIRTSNLRCHLSPKQCEICKYLWVQRKVFNNVYNSIANYNQTQKAIMFFHYVFFLSLSTNYGFSNQPKIFLSIQAEYSTYVCQLVVEGAQNCEYVSRNLLPCCSM